VAGVREGKAGPSPFTFESESEADQPDRVTKAPSFRPAGGQLSLRRNNRFPIPVAIARLPSIHECW
jgi:hypothetical protein